MTRTALAAFAAFFVTIGPLDTAALFLGLTRQGSARYRRQMALRGIMLGGGILMVFALVGDDLLEVLEISLAAVRVGGGILLLLLSIRIVLGEDARTEQVDGEGERDISVFPLALPLIAGPGAITATVVLSNEVHNHFWPTVVILAMMGLVLALTLACLLFAGRLERLLGPTGMNVLTRVFGFLLTALSAELVLQGMRDSGVFH